MHIHTLGTSAHKNRGKRNISRFPTGSIRVRFSCFPLQVFNFALWNFARGYFPRADGSSPSATTGTGSTLPSVTVTTACALRINVNAEIDRPLIHASLPSHCISITFAVAPPRGLTIGVYKCSDVINKFNKERMSA